MSQENVILIGMSGAGKSTLGVLLAKALGKDFTDTDIVIQKRTGKTLQQIIDSEGTDAFLHIEEEIVSSLSFTDCVVATGGSVVYSEKIMSSLSKNAYVVYLAVPFEELTERLHNITTRGIVIKNGSTLQDVYRERIPLYEKYSDLVIDCSKQGIEESVEAILHALLAKEQDGCHETR